MPTSPSSDDPQSKGYKLQWNAVKHDTPPFIPDVETPCMSDPDLWTPEAGDREYAWKRAKKRCRMECPVINDCLMHALVDEKGFPGYLRMGVRGGMTPLERYRLEKKS